MNKNKKEEEQYLEVTLKKIQEQIKDSFRKLEKIPKMYKNERLIENLTKQYSDKVIFLEKTQYKKTNTHNGQVQTDHRQDMGLSTYWTSSKKQKPIQRMRSTAFIAIMQTEYFLKSSTLALIRE